MIIINYIIYYITKLITADIRKQRRSLTRDNRAKTYKNTLSIFAFQLARVKMAFTPTCNEYE